MANILKCCDLRYDKKCCVGPITLEVPQIPVKDLTCSVSLLPFKTTVDYLQQNLKYCYYSNTIIFTVEGEIINYN